MMRLCRYNGRAVPVNDVVYPDSDAGKLAARAVVERLRIGRDVTAFPGTSEFPYVLVPETDIVLVSVRESVLLRHADSRIEGYWQMEYRRPDDPHLPMPEVQSSAWNGQEDFLRCLAVVEAIGKPEVSIMHFMGTSECRICGMSNGSGEFYDARPDANYGWRWPSGLRHYVEAHNVELSVAFQNYIAWSGSTPAKS